MSFISLLVVGLVFAYVGFVVGCVWMQSVCDAYPAKQPPSIQAVQIPSAREVRRRKKMLGDLRANIIRRA